MPQGSNGSRLTPVIVGWVLKVMILLIVGIATLSYHSLTNKLDDQELVLDDLSRLMTAAVLADSLQGRDISALGTKLHNHVNDEGRHN